MSEFQTIGNTDVSLSWTETVFPTANQVATTDLATLRTAGLSGRKAEYGRCSITAWTFLLTCVIYL